MRTINLYGVVHAYVAENGKLSNLLRKASEAVELTVPVEHINNEEYIEKKLIETIKANYNKSIELSWIQNPNRMEGW